MKIYWRVPIPHSADSDTAINISMSLTGLTVEHFLQLKTSPRHSGRSHMVMLQCPLGSGIYFSALLVVCSFSFLNPIMVNNAFCSSRHKTYILGLQKGEELGEDSKLFFQPGTALQRCLLCSTFLIGQNSVIHYHNKVQDD